MQYRQLGKTDLTVSEVGFGVWTVATNWWGKIDSDERVKLLQEAVTLGVTMFDTADTYSEGFGEEILAKAIGPSRHDVVYATKFGYDIYNAVPREGHRERPQNFSPEFIRYACEQSLRRLNTDYIDLYQLHNPRVTTIERDEVFNTLEELVQEGKVRYYGAALGPDIGWFEEGDTMMRERDGVSLQIIYSIIEQQPARDFFPIAKEHTIGLLSRVPHASEILTEKFRNTPPGLRGGRPPRPPQPGVAGRGRPQAGGAALPAGVPPDRDGQARHHVRAGRARNLHRPAQHHQPRDPAHVHLGVRGGAPLRGLPGAPAPGLRRGLHQGAGAAGQGRQEQAVGVRTANSERAQRGPDCPNRPAGAGSPEVDSRPAGSSLRAAACCRTELVSAPAARGSCASPPR